MTGRTHDLAAFTTLTYVIATQPLPHLSLGTAIIAFGANMIGGIAPDLDQPTGDFWHKLPGGTLYSRLFTPLLGGHRYISHSLLGIALFGFLLRQLLNLASHAVLVNMDIVWWAFMLGFISHLVMDTFTREGVPWLFPLPIKFGIPPLIFLRVRTGSMVEKFVIFPGLLAINAYLVYAHYGTFIQFLHSYIR